MRRCVRDSPQTLAVMGVYGGGLPVLFGTSAADHALIGRRPAFRPALRRIDHASIYVTVVDRYLDHQVINQTQAPTSRPHGTCALIGSNV